ncbi:hypothetical protein CQZ94_00235 [Bacillus sp. MYb209]|nr:hypothetical protein CQZ94_00235 [Bacillus sp. MYb209]
MIMIVSESYFKAVRVVTIESLKITSEHRLRKGNRVEGGGIVSGKRTGVWLDLQSLYFVRSVRKLSGNAKLSPQQSKLLLSSS